MAVEHLKTIWILAKSKHTGATAIDVFKGLNHPTLRCFMGKVRKAANEGSSELNSMFI